MPIRSGWFWNGAKNCLALKAYAVAPCCCGGARRENSGWYVRKKTLGILRLAAHPRGNSGVLQFRGLVEAGPEEQQWPDAVSYRQRKNINDSGGYK